MTDEKKRDAVASPSTTAHPRADHAPPATSAASEIEAFVAKASSLAPATASGARRGRLVFALDATMSRQPTWDLACSLQAQMFETTAQIGGLAVQLVYFRGFSECRASRWVVDPAALTAMMTKIDCRGGHTQIGRVLSHVRNEARGEGVDAFVLVGDAFEEDIDAVCAKAGELGLLNAKGFFFQEGGEPNAERAFREMARLTGGAYARFDAGAPGALAGLLRAAATYASAGANGLERLAAREPQAQALLTAMRRKG